MKFIRKFYRIFDKNILFLFVVALTIRILSAFLFRKYIGLQYSLWNFETEGFGDFEYFYQEWVKNFISLNWYPYSYGNSIKALDNYSYPPFFLYLLSIFGLPWLPAWGPAIPIVLSDVGCTILVYKILNLHISKKQSLYGSLIYCFSAINIFYIDIYWLNPSPMILFLLISIYYIFKNSNYKALIFLVISIMMKQTALYFAPIIFSSILGKKDIKYWWKPLTLFICLGILFSTPYIFLTPSNYFNHLFASPNPSYSMTVIKPEKNQPVTFQQFLRFGLNIKGPIIKILSLFIDSYVLILVSISIIFSYSLFSIRNNKLKELDIFYLLIINGFLSYLFQPKGLYKYYLSTLMPFLIFSLLLGIYYVKITNKTKYGLMLAYIIFNIIVIFSPRIITYIPILLMFEIIVILYYKYNKIPRTINSIYINAHKQDYKNL